MCYTFEPDTFFMFFEANVGPDVGTRFISTNIVEKC